MSQVKSSEIRVEITDIKNGGFDTTLCIKDACGNTGELSTAIDVKELVCGNRLMLGLTQDGELSAGRYSALARVVTTGPAFEIICVVKGKVVDTIKRLDQSVN